MHGKEEVIWVDGFGEDNWVWATSMMDGLCMGSRAVFYGWDQAFGFLGVDDTPTTNVTLFLLAYFHGSFHDAIMDVRNGDTTFQM